MNISPLEGRWQMTRGALAGERVPDLVVENSELELDGGVYRVRFAKQVVEEGQYSIRDDGTRRKMLWRGLIGPNCGRYITCEYRVRGGLLHIRFDFSLDCANGDNPATPLIATYRRVG